jgi:hypothetical protein
MEFGCNKEVLMIIGNLIAENTEATWLVISINEEIVLNTGVRSETNHICVYEDTDCVFAIRNGNEGEACLSIYKEGEYITIEKPEGTTSVTDKTLFEYLHKLTPVKVCIATCWYTSDLYYSEYNIVFTREFNGGVK